MPFQVDTGSRADLAPGQRGWLKDRWGLSWQIIPRALGECLGGSDRAGAARAMEAMLGMSKLDVKALKAACRGAVGERPRGRH